MQVVIASRVHMLYLLVLHMTLKELSAFAVAADIVKRTVKTFHIHGYDPLFVSPIASFSLPGLIDIL